MEASNAINYFHYNPSKSLAAMSMATYLLLAIYLTTRIYTSKSASFLYMLPVIAFFQCIGFLYRISCINSTTIAKYIIMNLFLVIPPYVLPLVNYMALGKLVRSSHVQTTHFFLNPTFITWFYFVAHIFSFWVQRIYNDDDIPIKSIGFGVIYIMFDVSLYSILSTCFIITAAYIYQNPNYICQVKNVPDAKGKLFFAIFTTTILQFIQTIFYACEYATGFEGDIATSEWAYYIFSVLPIMLCYTVYSILFIGDYFRQEDVSNHQYNQLSRFDDLDEENMDMIPENGKHVAVFNNVQSVNYSIGLES